MNKKVAIIGGGNIGTSIANGLAKSQAFPKNNIIITRAASEPLDDLLKQGFQAMHNNCEAVKLSDYIILAVQPRQAINILKNIKEVLNPQQHSFISVVSALDIEEIENIIGEEMSIIRIMPNTAISICESMTCMAGNAASSKTFPEIRSIFDKLGRTLIIDEKMMAAATVLSSCGTAFMLRFMRAAAQGGIQIGFHANEAQHIVSQVAKGAAELLLQNQLHPEQEIDKVTTPMGVTIKGLNEMEHNGLSSAVIKGIVHSFNEMDKIK